MDTGKIISLILPSGRCFFPNTILKHFKGTQYKIINFATHTETNEVFVIYTDLNNTHIWARPFLMFDSLVDTIKYPEVTQKYRFEIEADL